jgi:hypothetical protein
MLTFTIIALSLSLLQTSKYSLTQPEHATDFTFHPNIISLFYFTFTISEWRERKEVSQIHTFIKLANESNITPTSSTGSSRR